MLAVLAFLIAAGDDEQAMRATARPPLVVPIPIGNPGQDYRYRLYTDWTSLAESRREWRTGTRLETRDRWEEAASGQPGGRIRDLIAAGAFDRAFATTGRNPAGGGGVDEGCEWSVFLFDSWTAGLDMEFTTNGPRIVLALYHFPFEGVTHRYGWSVLAGQFVHGIGWHLDDEDMRALYHWLRFRAVMQCVALSRYFGPYR